MTSEAEDEIGITEVRKTLHDSLHTAIFAKSDEELEKAERKLRHLFLYVYPRNDLRDEFFTMLRLRLELLTASTAMPVERARCFRMITQAAVMALSAAQNAEFVDFLVCHCSNSCLVEDAGVRQNVCVILRFLFEQAVIAKQDNELEDDEDVFGEAASFLIGREHFNMMYLVLRKMVKHIEPEVRAKALEALTCIQHEQHIVDDAEETVLPRQILYDHLLDSAAECRLAALKDFAWVENDHQKRVLHLATADPDPQVRVVGLRKIAASNFKSWTHADRTLLLTAMLQETRPEVSEAYRELAIEWIRVVCCVEGDKPIEEKQAVPYNLFCSAPLFILRHVSTKNRNKGFDDMMQALFDICFGMKRKQTLLDFLKVTLSNEKDVILHAQNYERLLDGEVHLSSKALRVYHWRRFVAFFAEKASDEGLRSQCLAKLLPMLHAFVAFVNSFITKFFKDGASVSGNVTVRDKRRQSPTVLRPTLIDLINMLPYLDPEPVGKASWKEMLIKKVLTNPTVPLNVELAEAAVTSLLDHHYEKDETQTILADFLGILNTIAQSSPLPGGSGGPDLATAQFGTDDAVVGVSMDQVSRVRCLLVTNAMLRTGCIADHLPKSLADQLHSSIIEDSLQSEHPTHRLLAYQCIGAISYAHREFAKKHMPEACVEELSDMIAQYGYSQTELWFAAVTTQCPGFPLYTSLVAQIGAEQSTLALEALRCLCRFALFGDLQQPPVPQALANLVLWYAKCLAAPEEYENDERVAALEKFFNAFCCDYVRQKACIQVLEEAFAVLDNADADSVFASVKRVDVSNVVVDLCKSDRLVKVTPEARSLPAHIILGEQILRLLAEIHNNADLSFWSKVLQRLVISSDTQLEKLRALITLCQAASENIGEYSTANKSVELFEKRLNTAVKRAATQKTSQTPARTARTIKKAPIRSAQRQPTSEASEVEVSEEPAKQDDSSATPRARQLMSPSRQLRSLRTRNPKPQPTLDIGDSPMDISDDSDF